jgi:hypothetical protein
MSQYTRQAGAFLALIAASGIGALSYGMMNASHWHAQEALALFGIAVAASQMKIKLPGLTGSMSVNLPFLLLAMADLNLAEALAIGCASAATQSWPNDGSKPKSVPLVFNVSLMATAIAIGWQLFHPGTGGQRMRLSGALTLPMAVSLIFLIQTVPVSIMIALTEGGLVRKIWTPIWTTIARTTFPYYVLSAGVASMMIAAREQLGWPGPILLFPVMYGTYRSFMTYLGRSAGEINSVDMAKAATAGH